MRYGRCAERAHTPGAMELVDVEMLIKPTRNWSPVDVGSEMLEKRNCMERKTLRHENNY
jgi:hypothetical protein